MKRAVYDCEKAYSILQSYDDVISMSLTDMDRTLLPAMVKAVSRALGRDHGNLAVLADAMMCAYLSDRLHNTLSPWAVAQEPSVQGASVQEVSVSGESQRNEDLDRQYAVLVGDYWLSESFFLLISHGLSSQISLRYLTELVRAMKLGALLRWRLSNKRLEPDRLPDIWALERGVLVADCGKLAADILGADASTASLFERFGRCLGLAWAAALETEEDAAEPETFLAEADAVIADLMPVADVSALVELRDYLGDQVTRDRPLGLASEPV